MKDQLHQELRLRWDDMTSFMNDSVKEKWWELILAHYSERPYYNLNHLLHMLKLFDEYKDKLKDRYAVTFAIFFKHLEHDSKSNENAKASAEKFREFCSETTFDQENYVVNLILESENNCTDANLSENQFGSEDIHYLIDFDMSVIGEDENKYNEYKSQVRKEYSDLSDKEYYNQRSKVLTLFLQIPNIYATQQFRNLYEAQARKNIADEIKSINDLSK
uniref:Uncharacterized protein n=1 Tax=Rhabditophanes sp. KR3021 TaxID=114890 RepID=A0AC35TZL1_9BILA